MNDCSALSDRMPEVVAGGAGWSTAEAEHLVGCADCTAEWLVVRVGATLHAQLKVDHERIAAGVLSRLRGASTILPLRRLPWRNFALGLAAAASVALAVWVPGRQQGVSAITLPGRVGPTLPVLSAMTEEQLDRMTKVDERNVSEGVPGAVPHLGDLTEHDLDELMQLTESP